MSTESDGTFCADCKGTGNGYGQVPDGRWMETDCGTCDGSGILCNNNGGQGSPRSHECRCFRPADHSDSWPYDRQHGCSCGALWGTAGDTE